MKTTRPVFESFSAFVNNLYEMELANPGSIGSLMENDLIQGSLTKGNGYSLPDLLKLSAGLTYPEDFVPAVKNLQISASSDPTAAAKLKEFSTQIRNLSTEEWIDQSNVGLFKYGLISSTQEAPYLYGDSGNVEVKGAPSMSDMTKIEAGVQLMSYSQMLALVSAYNASIFIKNLEIQKKNINTPKEVKKIIKGRDKIYEKMPLAYPKDQLVVTVTGGNSQIVVTSVEKLNPNLIESFNLDYDSYESGKLLTDPEIAQFKYIFPVITGSKESSELLSIETRQKTIAPDKSKDSSEVTDFPLAIEESGKATFYVTNKADLTDAGKAAAASLTRMFSKITKVIVEGSADKRSPGSPWKDNDELASARRDKMMEYLKELAGDPNSSLSGADIEEGSVAVQPKGEPNDGSDDPKILASWRAVKIKVSGSIYDETKNVLPKGDDKQPKKVTYTEVKKAREYTFTNCIIAYRYDYPELASDKKQFGSK
jgi:flagellar motor protein MotB